MSEEEELIIIINRQLAALTQIKEMAAGFKSIQRGSVTVALNLADCSIEAVASAAGIKY